ncbi:septation ring formation regulator EzrA [Gracilibacillus boraciitolerans JCM 21714]|uniref:Septation ring formation regulator EzrA n=1 Tax=Gracilibacillus boraciitolerans JCM 21714 TaxID=1298598 RepID=W4VHU4_9BACI|nr:septation ring formation regulator EzrA [Gracilibacillus boraciitolerans]GAE92950.1 septation ring formation regulator EzrA [Gracilibacillus boraciitolerans JCM 21714]
MLEFVIGGILLIIALIIVGLIFRKKIYDHVDRLEAWKMDIMNRNVTSELAKVKQLNLSGETQEKFESWKENWDMILTRELPDMEEYLLDAEEAADKFRIQVSKKNLRIVEESLKNIEKNIENMYEELDHLLDSEKYARQKIEELDPRIKDLKKYLLHNRTQFGNAEIIFEAELTKTERKLTEYAQLTEDGNYIEAQELIELLIQEIDIVEEKVSAFPEIYRQCKQTIPDQMKELLKGMEEMEEEGYRVQQFGFEKELKQYESHLKDAIIELENGEIKSIVESLEQMEDRLIEMFQLLEKEAKSKSIVESQLPNQKQKLQDIQESMAETSEQIKELQQTYFIEEAELELFLSVKKWLEKSEKLYEQIEVDYKNRKANHLEIKEKLDIFTEELEKLKQAHQDFQVQVRDLRKDEMEAKEKLAELKKDLIRTNKQLQKSNIPGIPSFVINALEEATEKCEVVFKNLQKHPLDMGKVLNSISEANKSVNNFVEQTKLLLDQARLVELAIQYGNRYRRSYPLLAAQLSEAEQFFRNYKYETALETAIKALEEVDPNVMSKIEEMDQNYKQMAN